MAEAEDVITDVARHATVYARDLWQRHRRPDPGAARAGAADGGLRHVELRDVARRLDLLVAAVFGAGLSIRAAQPPAPPTLLARAFGRVDGATRGGLALPATDGAGLWLPARLPVPREPGAPQPLDHYRVLALQQAARARSGAAAVAAGIGDGVERGLFLLLLAHAADRQLARQLPGLVPALTAARRAALRARPPPGSLPAAQRPLEAVAQRMLADADWACTPAAVAASAASAASAAFAAPDGVDAAAIAEQACRQAAGLQRDRDAAGARRARPADLQLDAWTGDLLAPSDEAQRACIGAQRDPAGADERPPRSARLDRRPRVRKTPEPEDAGGPGAWMVQTAQPHEKAEDPIGMQKPTDRGEEVAAADLADGLSELPEARLVATPGRAREVLLSDDAPAVRSAFLGAAPAAPAERLLRYPEWDWRADAYRPQAVTVHLQTAAEGPQAWVDRTLARRHALAQRVRRQFEMLRAQRQRLRKQLDGDEVDIDACIEAHADLRAGLPRSQAVYQSQRAVRRDLALVLLVDVSGSTDAWVGADQRVVDVERVALLLVSIALQGLAAPHAVLVFSGEGPHGVVVREVKRHDEPYGPAVARRIAALEPEHYTRAGAALRHATAELMQQPARHRLLLLLSDGKPNDVDCYEGRYGVEDMRRAVVEARLQGIHPFCLTVDTRAASYLPGVFGARQYALLPRAERLPAVLLDWLRRLLKA